MHGGATPSGIASVHFKGRGRSKAFVDVLPKNLRARFIAALEDNELLSLRQYVALAEAKVVESLEKYAALDSGSFRADLNERWSAFKSANALPATTDEERRLKAEKLGQALRAVDEAIGNGAAEVDAWADVAAAIKDRMNATEAENRRLIAMEQMLTIEQAMALVMVVTETLRRHIDDRVVLSTVATDIEQQLGLKTPLRIAAGA